MNRDISGQLACCPVGVLGLTSQHRRRPARTLRPRRLLGMRRRHLNAADSDPVSCRPQSDAHRVAGLQPQISPVSLPQVQHLEIRTPCSSQADAFSCFSSSRTNPQGFPVSPSSSCRTVPRPANFSPGFSTSTTRTEPHPCAVSTPTVLPASTSGSERISYTTTPTSLPSSLIFSNQTMSLSRTSLPAAPPTGVFTASRSPVTSQCPRPVSETRQHPPVGVGAGSPDLETGQVNPGSPAAQGQPDQEQIMEETITAVKVPMMRPNPFLLQVIRAAGGIGDVFTMRQIIHHVKNYIGQRLMYDRRNPSITHCDGDLLGQALGVKQFSILEAIGLFQRSCTLVQESCIRTIRHLEARPSTVSGSSRGQGERGDAQPLATRPAAATTTGVEPAATTVSDRGVYREVQAVPDVPSSCSSPSLLSSQSLSSSNPRLDRSQSSFVMTPTSTTDDSAMTTSLSASQESSSWPSYTEVSSSVGSQDVGPSVSQTASQDLSQPSPPSQPSPSFSSSASSTSAVINFRAAQSSVTLSDLDLRNHQSGQSSAESCNDGRRETVPGHHKDGIVTREGRINPKRTRGASINLLLDEPDGDAGPWECTVRVHTGRGPSDTGDAAADNAEDETVVVEYESDHFSVEYEVASSSDEQDEGEQNTEQRPHGTSDRARSVSEASSHGSGPGTRTAMLVVCKESDVEYLADYSDTDTGSDAELSEGGSKSLPGDCASGTTNAGVTPCPTIPVNHIGIIKDQSTHVVSSSSGDDPKTSSQASVRSRQSQVQNPSGPAACPDSKTNAEIFKAAAAAASKLRAKKRQYSSGLSTSDSQDDCPKNKSQPLEITEHKSREKTKPEIADKSVKSNEETVTRARKQRPSLYSERTLGVLSKNEACVVCLTRPKTASIIHGKTGHQVCCYSCAKKLKKQRRACPICRRPIQKVIRNYHV
ncbi:E3 ubiquitin-protein ligase Mdm2-like [Elysia marginata]|uniref:E3 ubiquitin-protein ligase Mdm2-like n=1 Tax=Elysia marginata TaxID=1093978 RepID=A0AAV4EZY1_9GAST|nr:E3 ubiquitin-protein ligase Mdm2-like [Elysia marginata]